MRTLTKGVIIFFIFFTFSLFSEENPTLAIVDTFGKGVKKTKTEIIYNYIMDKINKSGEFTIVERTMLDKALEEMELSNSLIADEETASQLGKIAGAKYILISSLTEEDDIFYLAMRVVETETAKIRNTSIKNTDNFKNVEQLTEDGIGALLELKIKPQEEKVTGTKLTGNGYFFDDSGDKGNSKITKGQYLNDRMVVEGQLGDKYEFAFIGGGIDFSEESRNKCKKAEGIQFRITGDNSYYFIKIKTSDIMDYAFYYKKFYAPLKETVIQIPFDEIHQPVWGKRVKFDRNAISGIDIATMYQPTLPVHIEVFDIKAIGKNEVNKKPNPGIITFTRFFGSDENCPGDSKYTRQYWEDTIGMRGIVTSKCPHAFLIAGIKWDDKSKTGRSKAKGIKFRIRGDGKDYRIEFLTPTTVKDYSWFKKIIKTQPQWVEVTILFEEIKQSEWGKKTTFNKNDLEGINIVTIGKPLERIYVEMADPEWIF
ncbi:MAG: CIA30 family protein [Spirochaetales bacterium]|nr:CIA30 family protein [Spirochaetales bacterium]